MEEDSPLRTGSDRQENSMQVGSEMAHSNKPLGAQLSTTGLLAAQPSEEAEETAQRGPESSFAGAPDWLDPPPGHAADSAAAAAASTATSADAGKTASLPAASTERVLAKSAVIRASQPRREMWDTKADFMLSVIGFAVDLGNVWRFPFICYVNGGGAFLIPYAIMKVFGGVPMLYLELALGQFQRTGCITVWNRICPLLTGIGFAICVVNMYVSFYYNTVIAWAVYYLFSSFTSSLPWTSCDNDWNTADCRDPFNVTDRANESSGPSGLSSTAEFFEYKVLGLDKAGGIGDLGGVKWDLALCLLAVYVVVFLSLSRGIKSSGKVVWVTATLPYICLMVLLVRGVTLEGASKGIIFYLEPKWKLLLEPQVWIDAAAQVFFSLGPGFGVMLAFSSYNKRRNNCYRDALVISGTNFLTSFISGFAIFSVLGYMATRQNTTVEKVTPADRGLVFVAVAEALSTLPAPGVLSVIFFIMIITLGLDSTFGGLESIITACSDKWPDSIGKKRALFVGVLISCCFAGSLSTVTYGGRYVIPLFDSYAVSITILAIVALEAVAIAWCYGLQSIGDDIQAMIGHRPGPFWMICWKFISPALILFIVAFAFAYYTPISFFPVWAEYLGWLLTASSIICVPVYAVYKLLITPGTFSQRVHECVHPQETAPQFDAETELCSIADV